jgi:nitroimidazol reductase NimA-like FMN-containing flavoprotein (pyridoxamine 5'-phosphate oxidase superfamily)
MITRLSQTEARELLHTSHIGRLGCIVEDGPYVVPVNYVYEQDCIYMHSLPGLKVEAMRQHPQVCLLVDRIESDSHWKSVIAYGNFEEIESGPEREGVLEHLLKHFPLMTPVESALAQDRTAPSPNLIVFRIRVEKITALGEA